MNYSSLWIPNPFLLLHTRSRLFRGIDEIPKYLKKPIDEIARDLADYCEQIKPDISSWHDFHNVRDMFWESHNSNSYHLPAEYRMKVDEIENKAKKILLDRKIPDFLRTSTIDELAAEMMKNPAKQYKSGFFKEWNDERLKGIKIQDLPEEIQDKLEAANDRVKELLENEREKEMRKTTLELVPEFIEWCTSNNLAEISRECVHAFVFEKKLKLPLDARAYLVFTAKQGLKKILNNA